MLVVGSRISDVATEAHFWDVISGEQANVITAIYGQYALRLALMDNGYCSPVQAVLYRCGTYQTRCGALL